MNSKFILGILILVVFVFYNLPQVNKQLKVSPTPSSTVAPSTNQVLGQQTKTFGCLVQGSLPDIACTPGAIIASATKDEICVPGYSKTVRNVPLELKRQVYEEYGIVSHQPGEYEVDHLISLELGGSNDISNLWPESADPRPGFHEKDMVENYLHQQLCNGAMSLSEAQAHIANNWLEIYNKVPNISDYRY